MSLVRVVSWIDCLLKKLAQENKKLTVRFIQMVWPETIGMAVEGIESAAFLTEEQKRDILYNNAVKFFRLNKK